MNSTNFSPHTVDSLWTNTITTSIDGGLVASCKATPTARAHLIPDTGKSDTR